MKKSYKNAGVDKAAGYKTVGYIKASTKSTHNKNVLNGIGDFAALYALGKYENPVLVSGTDGVGTKMLLAKKYHQWETIGMDCFAMCVNDILCHGARPLFFLDYIACGKLHPTTAHRIIQGITEACRQTGTALIGGETAEMPGMYQIGDYDVAGFCVGIVEKKDIINGQKNIQEGDLLIGIASSGVHSNGFSLIRHLVKNFNQKLEGKPLHELLLTPTKLYVNPILHLLKKYPHHIKGMAHITGGGIIENVPRMLPSSLCASVSLSRVPTLPIFEHLKTYGVAERELWSTFNMGVGFTFVVAKEHANKLIKALHTQGEHAFVMGEIKKKHRKEIELLP